MAGARLPRKLSSGFSGVERGDISRNKAIHIMATITPKVVFTTGKGYEENF
jgi:hypothetical protein